jgi:Fungal protein kinase
MIGFCFAPKSVVGYDPTMLTDDWDKVMHIICDSRKFKVIKAIFKTQLLVRRTTRVWEVGFEGQTYILKDSWIKSSRPMAEYKLLQRLQGMEGISQFFCGEDVCINGKTLSTDIVWQGKWGIRSKVWVRQRIVSSSIGDHIASFRLKRELISALHDITIGMYLSLSLICAQWFFFFLIISTQRIVQKEGLDTSGHQLQQHSSMSFGRQARRFTS